MSRQFKSLPFILFIALSSACEPTDTSEDTAFLKAVRLGKTEQISELLAKDPKLLDEKTQLKGLTALHIAAQKSDRETIALLLQKGANLNETSNNGNTALHYAIKNFRNAYQVSRVLLEAGLNPSTKNDDGDTVWDLLLKKKPKGKFFKAENQLLALLLKYDYTPTIELDEDQSTLLHQLSERAENPEIIRLLIENHQLDPKSTDAYGWTPLHYAAKGINEEICIVLLDYGADINAQTTKDRDKEMAKSNGESRYKYPKGATPRDIYNKHRAGKSKKSLMRFFDEYGGKRSRDLP